MLKADRFRLNRKTIQEFLAWLQTTQGYAASTILTLCRQPAGFCPVPAERRLYSTQSGPGTAVAGKEGPGTERAGRCPDAQRSRFEAAFQTPRVDKVTKHKRSHETLAGLRLIHDKAIAHLMLFAGPRVEEVERLTLEDIELRPKSGVLHIRQGKGFRERDVPLPKPAREPLEAWLKEREKLAVPHEALFVELRAGGWRLSRRSMQNMVAEAGHLSGLGRLDPPVKVSPHILRHTYAYMLRQTGVSTEVQAEMSGHSIETAMKYGRPKTREKERAAEALDDMAGV